MLRLPPAGRPEYCLSLAPSASPCRPILQDSASIPAWPTAFWVRRRATRCARIRSRGALLRTATLLSSYSCKSSSRLEAPGSARRRITKARQLPLEKQLQFPDCFRSKLLHIVPGPYAPDERGRAFGIGNDVGPPQDVANVFIAHRPGKERANIPDQLSLLHDAVFVADDADGRVVLQGQVFPERPPQRRRHSQHIGLKIGSQGGVTLRQHRRTTATALRNGM